MRQRIDQKPHFDTLSDMPKLLGATRLSRQTDESTAIDRQRDQITHTAAARGDTVVAITEDVDVSGAVSPFEREDLGPWLTDPKLIAMWTVLCVSKLDRLTRSIKDFVAIVDWCQRHGKTIVSIGDSFDLGTPVGRMVAHILALFAQFERERMSERRADHVRKAVTLARWDGRAIAPGYRPVKVGDHWELEIDEARQQQINAMADAITSGKSARQAGAEFGMDAGQLIKLLRNQGLRGYVLHHGDVVRGEDGLPVQRTPVIEDEKWAKLQDALDKNSNPGSGARKNGAAMLLGVAQCDKCGKHLYINRRANGDRYRHHDEPGAECRGGFLAKALESAVGSKLMELAGDEEITEKIIIPGKNNSEEIRRITESIYELDKAFETGDVPAKTFGRMQSKLEDRLARLEAEPGTPDQFIERPLGMTYRQQWASLDEQGRGKFLRDAGIRMHVSRLGQEEAPEQDSEENAREREQLTAETAELRKGRPTLSPEMLDRSYDERTEVTTVKSGSIKIVIEWGIISDVIRRARLSVVS